MRFSTNPPARDHFSTFKVTNAHIPVMAIQGEIVEAQET